MTFPTKGKVLGGPQIRMICSCNVSLQMRAVTPAASTRFAPQPPALRPQHTAQNTYSTGLVF
jgi:hypothetical protein